MPWPCQINIYIYITYTYSYTYLQVCAYIHTVYAHVCICMYSYTYFLLHSNICNICAYTIIYIYIYTCVYTYMWVCLICWGHLKIQGLKFRGSSIRFSHDLIGSDKTWESEVEKSRDLNKKRGRVVEWLWRVGECFQQKMNG